MGRSVICPTNPSRIVSLVPSDTYSLYKLGCGERLVGKTDYCDLPEAAKGIPSIGGTKNVRVEDVLDLRPQLVVANQEENTRPVLEKLAQAGVPVYISFPRRVEDGFAHLAKLMRLLESTNEMVVKLFFKQAYALKRPQTSDPAPKVFVPIWNKPLMTFNQDTYGHSFLEFVGLQNVFGLQRDDSKDSEDLGRRSPLGADQKARQEKRYPKCSDEELSELDVDMVLLPDEPYEFGDNDVSRFKEIWAHRQTPPQVVQVSGKDLFWPGVHTLDAIKNVQKQLTETI